jgi:L-ascorbate metabolism protein UlaG (beta-lactamase superfamily)
MAKSFTGASNPMDRVRATRRVAQVKVFAYACIAFLFPLMSASAFERDTVQTSGGPLVLTFIGHGTLMMEFQGHVIHCDPWARLADYGTLPRADVVLITHEHGDHLDPQALQKIRTDSTVVILTEACAEKVSGGTIMRNGDIRTVAGVTVEAVPAYNLVHKRDDGTFFHPKGRGNGYVLTFGKTRVYVAGDTENTPEMKALKNIDIAFLPMNLPYTMTPEMVQDAALAFRPAILYPYHYGKTDPQNLVELLKGEKKIEVRVRKME